MSDVSVTKAAELSGVSRQTLYNDMESGKLSFTPKGKNGRVINVAELERVYGSLSLGEKGDKDVSRSVKSGQNELTLPENQLIELIKLREKLSGLESLTDQQQDEIENLRKSLDKAQDSHQRLLEDKREDKEKTDSWKKSFDALEHRIANQEKVAKEREEREQKLLDENRRIRQAYSKQKKALEDEKNKSFWKKLFG